MRRTARYNTAVVISYITLSNKEVGLEFNDQKEVINVRNCETNFRFCGKD